MVLLASCGVAKSQDVINTKNHERIEAKILEVSDTEIRYKKSNNPDGPTFVMPTSKIASITYSTGEVQRFEQDESTPQTASPDAKEGEKKPSVISQVGNAVRREIVTTEPYNRKYRGLEFAIHTGVEANTTGGPSFIGLIGFGRRFGDNFYFSIQSGVTVSGNNDGSYTGDRQFVGFPLHATLRPIVPIPNTKLDLFLDLTSGCTFIRDNDYRIYPLRIMPGV